MLAFVQYLVDGVIANAAGIAGLMGAAGSVQIPVLSEIWQALTGAPLTVLDVIAFVVAIPVTRTMQRRLAGYDQFKEAMSQIEGIAVETWPGVTMDNVQRGMKVVTVLD